MTLKISVVINTLNEELLLDKCIKNLSWADEIIVCDMYSEDNTVENAKKNGAKVIFHKKLPFVEPARGYAVSQAKNEWILIVDSDEVIPPTLADLLLNIKLKDGNVEYVEIPRKNIIFGKWLKHSMWWPDYNIRFFKKGSVKWGKIHAQPVSNGQGIKLDVKEENAIIHYHYNSINQYINRSMRYTDIQASELIKEGYIFNWTDLILKPFNEFLSRYFSNHGYKDGLHGFVVSLLQAFSHLILYLKVWEHQKYPEEKIELDNLIKLTKDTSKDLGYWYKYVKLPENKIARIIKKGINRFL